MPYFDKIPLLNEGQGYFWAYGLFMCHDEVGDEVGFWRFGDCLATKLCHNGLATKLCHQVCHQCQLRRRRDDLATVWEQNFVLKSSLVPLVTKFRRQTVVTKFRLQTVAKPSKPNFGVHFVVAHEDSISSIFVCKHISLCLEKWHGIYLVAPSVKIGWLTSERSEEVPFLRGVVWDVEHGVACGLWFPCNFWSQK